MIGQETMFTCVAAADEDVVFRLGCEIAPEAKRQSPSLREKQRVSGGLKKKEEENPQPIVCSSVRDSLTLKSGIFPTVFISSSNDVSVCHSELCTSGVRHAGDQQGAAS